jgi:hypothetical protein
VLASGPLAVPASPLIVLSVPVVAFDLPPRIELKLPVALFS